MKLLITGINGFVGQALAKTLLEQKKWLVTGAVRSIRQPSSVTEDGIQILQVGDIDHRTDWSETLRDVDVIVHLAARVHLLTDTSPDPLAEFRLVNTEGTRRLAQQAAEAGVKRFVYLSSIKVNGEATVPEREDSTSTGSEVQTRFVETDSVRPLSPYAVSKWEAEELLRKHSLESGMEVVIIRPPLVYGPGVRANFLRLLDLVQKGVPLPLKSLTNRRSMVYLGNLVDFIVVCVEHQGAGGQVFLLSDGADLSTPELIRRMALYMSKPAWLFSCPAWLLRCGAKLLGKSSEVDRLAGSLQVDIGKARRVLGWSPPFTVDEGLKKTITWCLTQGAGE